MVGYLIENLLKKSNAPPMPDPSSPLEHSIDRCIMVIHCATKKATTRFIQELQIIKRHTNLVRNWDLFQFKYCTYTPGSGHSNEYILYGTYTLYFYSIKNNIDLDKYDSDNKFIKERRFEVILTSFSSSNYNRKRLN